MINSETEDSQNQAENDSARKYDLTEIKPVYNLEKKKLTYRK